jgi:hypothetical protein
LRKGVRRQIGTVTLAAEQRFFRMLRAASGREAVLRGHFADRGSTGNAHFDASLAYRMATDKTGHEMNRSDAMKDPAFRTAFDQAKALLRDGDVAFIDIDNPLELYLFEAYCTMELNTCKWNTFRTH